MLLTISLFGMDTGALRFIPSALAKQETRSKYMVSFVFPYRFKPSFPSVVVLHCLSFYWQKAKKIQHRFLSWLFWAVVLLPFLAFIYQASSVLRALQQIKISMLPVYILLPVSIGLGCIYYYNEHNKLPVDAAMMINPICTFAVCIFINRKAGKTVNQIIPEAEPVVEARFVDKCIFRNFSSVRYWICCSNKVIFCLSVIFWKYKAGIYGAAVKISTPICCHRIIGDGLCIHA